MPNPLAPRYWGAHLLALVLVAIAVALGLWQYGAWQAHREAEAVDLTHAEPIPLAEAMGPDDPFPAKHVGQPVTVAGTWVPDGTVYVSGRMYQGTDGYWVVTPVTVDGAGGAALPVVRGWVADPADAPAPTPERVELDAWLQPTEGTGERDEDPTDDVLPQVRVGDLIQHVDQDLYGAYGVAEVPGEGLEPASVDQLPEVSALTGLKNFLYAVEWWVFGLFAAFIWWRWVREVSSEQAVAGEAVGEPGPTG